MEYDKTKFLIEERNNNIFLKKYLANEKTIVIPEGVTGIEFDAFGDSFVDKNLCAREIVLPDSLLSLSDGNFAGFRNLEKINIPLTLKDLPELAFINCPKMKQLKIPASITKLGLIAFAEDNIKILVPDTIQSVNERFIYIKNSFSNEATVNAFLKNPIYEVIDDFLINTNTMTLLFKLHRDSETVKVPYGVENIASGAFSEGRFFECGLSKNEETELESQKRINKVILPKTVKRIYCYAFEDCTKLEEVIYEGDSENLEIFFGAFSGCQVIEKLVEKTLIKGKLIKSPSDDKNKRFTHLMLDRLIIINKILKSGKCLNSEKIRQQVNEELNLYDIEDQYSLRTIGTDIETLITRFNAPIVYDRKRHGYVYTKDFDLVF